MSLISLSPSPSLSLSLSLSLSGLSHLGKTYLIYVPKKVFLPKKFFVINLFNQSNYPILNTIVASEQMCSGKIFCFKFTLRTFLVISPITKLDFKTLITFYKVYWVFGIAVKWFANVMNFVRISLSKS